MSYGESVGNPVQRVPTVTAYLENIEAMLQEQTIFVQGMYETLGPLLPPDKTDEPEKDLSSDTICMLSPLGERMYKCAERLRNNNALLVELTGLIAL